MIQSAAGARALPHESHSARITSELPDVVLEEVEGEALVQKSLSRIQCRKRGEEEAWRLTWLPGAWLVPRDMKPRE